MAPITNGRVLVNAYLQPGELPVPGQTTVYDTTQTIDLATVPLNGGFLIKLLVVAVDPFLVAGVRAPEANSPMPPLPLGSPLMGYGIAVVLRSELAGVAVGSHFRGALPHCEYSVVPALNPMMEPLTRDPDSKLDWSVYLGAAGLAGETAFCGWTEHAHAKKGEVVFVSSGAGGTGSVVVQLAKQAGLKVIASAGSDEKVKFMKEVLGADVAFNYNTTNTREVLQKQGPINIYWDNVGGATLNDAVEALAVGGRVIMCGQVSRFTDTTQTLKNTNHFIVRALTLAGFNMYFLRPKHLAAFNAEVVPRVARGEIKYAEDVREGLGSVGGLLGEVLRSGGPLGRVVVRAGRE
ncbi:hypothetical protein C8R46DRAFT_1042843 [Mycena filopes]|nr:hypothetical protein C8R46DRAFT_1042843 [Mycena filopes]